jgi:hypothetical protein
MEDTGSRFPLSASPYLSMAHVTPTPPSLASVFRRTSASVSWSKLEDDHELSELQSKFWGKKIEDDAKEWRKSHPTVRVDHTNDIDAGCYGLDLGTEDLRCSKMWVRKDYIRIYDFCSRQVKEASSTPDLAPSVVITGQPGVGVFLSSVAACALSNNPLREKVKPIGILTPSVVVSANRCHSCGIEVASSASCLSRKECFNKASRVSPPMALSGSYGHSWMQMHAQMVFPRSWLIVTQTSLLCSPPLRSESDGRH